MTGRLTDAVRLPLVLGHVVVDHRHDVGPGGERGQHSIHALEIYNLGKAQVNQLTFYIRGVKNTDQMWLIIIKKTSKRDNILAEV